MQKAEMMQWDTTKKTELDISFQKYDMEVSGDGGVINFCVVFQKICRLYCTFNGQRSRAYTHTHTLVHILFY